MDVPRLTDRQCRIFLKDMREFGYTKLTFDEVRRRADQIADGKEISDVDVIGLIMKRQIDDAMRDVIASRKSQ